MDIVSWILIIIGIPVVLWIAWGGILMIIVLFQLPKHIMTGLKERKQQKEIQRMKEREEKRELESLIRWFRNQETFEDTLWKIRRFERYLQEGKTTDDVSESERDDYITFLVYKGEQDIEEEFNK
jgi:hypothetical protein